MRTLRMFALVAPLLAASACVVVDPFGPSVSGTYYLISANGQSVPAVVVSVSGPAGFTAYVTDGEMRLRSDRTFRFDLDFVESDAVSDTYFTQGLSGTWDRHDDVVHLTYNDPDTGAWRTVTAYREFGKLEVTFPGLLYGLNIRMVLDR